MGSSSDGSSDACTFKMRGGSIEGCSGDVTSFGAGFFAFVAAAIAVAAAVAAAAVSLTALRRRS